MSEHSSAIHEIEYPYGHGICDAYGTKHCVGKCQDPRDCGATPIPEINKIVTKLGEWRNEDHEDFLVLSRHEVITIHEALKEIDWMY